MTNAPNNIAAVYKAQVLETPGKVSRQLHSLEPSAIIELFQLRLTEEVNGIDIEFFYHAGTNELSENIVFDGITYSAVPIEVTGFEVSTKGTIPRPKMKIANANHAISELIVSYNPLKARVRRIRTCQRFLDAENFPSGNNNNADPDAIIGGTHETWFIDRVVNENQAFVEFELVGKLDLTNLRLPGRLVVEHCPWKYKGQECGYTGKKKFNLKNQEVENEENDQCAKNLKACELRFPKGKGTGRLPFGGFPGARLQV